ncbi:MAG: hypothetical protein R3B84_17810 [Zavarzinella sp.]
MKIYCECGTTIHDASDCIKYKAHFIPDEVMNKLMEAIDEAIEKSGPTAKGVQPVIREGWVTDLANWGVKRWVFLRYQGF